MVRLNTRQETFLKTQSSFSGDYSRNLQQSVEVLSNANTGSSINGSTIVNAVGDLLQIYNLQGMPKPKKKLKLTSAAQGFKTRDFAEVSRNILAVGSPAKGMI